MPLVETYQPKIVMPCHHDDLYPVFIDMATEPLKMRVHEQLPGGQHRPARLRGAGHRRPQDRHHHPRRRPGIMISRSSATPPWQQLANLLRGRIESGEWQPGDSDSSVVSLAQEYELAAGTVRKAITALQQEGLLVSRVGSGDVRRGALRARAAAAQILRSPR